MNKFVIVLLVALSISSQSFALIVNGGEVQNGGGGFNDKGRYMTFGSADIPVADSPEVPAQIPGMNYLISQIDNMPLPDATKSAILLGVVSTADHSYFRILDDKMTLDFKKAIIAKYAEMMHVPPEKVVLFAATGAETHTTLLFPEFYKLTETENAAIILHESFWVSHIGLDNYDSIVALEQAAQAYFETPKDAEKYFKFFQLLSGYMGERHSLVYASLMYDIGNEKSRFYQNTKVPLQKLLPDSLLRCAANFYFKDVGFGAKYKTDVDRCFSSSLAEFAKLSVLEPDTLTWKAWIEFLNNPDGRGVFTFNGSLTSGDDIYQAMSGAYLVPEPDLSTAEIMLFKIYDSFGKNIGTFELQQ